MSGYSAQQEAKQVELHATVIRANGDREELGQIAYWHRNPVRRVIHRALNGKTGKITK